MKQYYDQVNNVYKTVRFHKDVGLPNNKDIVEVIAYKANNFVCINKKTTYSNKLKQCSNVDAFIKQLFASKPKQSAKDKTNKKNGNNSKKNTASQKNGMLKRNGINSKKDCNNSADNIDNKDIITCDGYKFDSKTGEVIKKIRSLESLRRSWYCQKDFVYNNASYDKSLFITATLDSKPSYDKLNKIVANYIRFVKLKYKIKCGFIFLEPCEDGSWYVHFILAFEKVKPIEFEEGTKKWWSKYNIKQSDEQVKIQDIPTVDDLIKIVNYLNPTSEKKRGRAKYYPVSGQPIRRFGTVEAPNKALTNFEIAKK